MGVKCGVGGVNKRGLDVECEFWIADGLAGGVVGVVRAVGSSTESYISTLIFGQGCCNRALLLSTNSGRFLYSFPHTLNPPGTLSIRACPL